jgi:hypothetical protein
METVFCAVRAYKKHGDIGSLLPGNAAVNMHPQQWEAMFSLWSVRRSYLNNKLRYGSVLSSEFSVEDSHGNFVELCDWKASFICNTWGV